MCDDELGAFLVHGSIGLTGTTCGPDRWWFQGIQSESAQLLEIVGRQLGFYGTALNAEIHARRLYLDLLKTTLQEQVFVELCWQSSVVGDVECDGLCLSSGTSRTANSWHIVHVQSSTGESSKIHGIRQGACSEGELLANSSGSGITRWSITATTQFYSSIG